MKAIDNQLVKILFRFYSNLLDQWTVETMWAAVVDADKGHYQIKNTPFYASIAFEDIVFAEYDETEGMLTYRDTFEFSGNSTIQVVMMSKAIAMNDVMQLFNEMGCGFEGFSESYFVLNIPADKDYQPIKRKLSELQDQGVIDYAEPVLSDQHYCY
ncbi:MAG: DUF4265 domain-containing protein [Chitinophagaceae bacterium]